jgi:hypothetical protein
MKLSDLDTGKTVRAFAGIGFRICDRCQSIYRPGNEGYTSDYIKLCDECLKEASAIRVESLTRELMYALKQHEKWENAFISGAFESFEAAYEAYETTRKNRIETLAKARRLLGDMDA